MFPFFFFYYSEKEEGRRWRHAHGDTYFYGIKKRGRGRKVTSSQLALKNVSRNIRRYASYFLSENVMLEEETVHSHS